MAITPRAVGAWAASNATTQTVTLPTHVAGDMLIVRAVRKPFTTGTDITVGTTGWNPVAAGFANGATANGAGTGSMRFRAFYKIAESASETNPVVTWGTTSAPGAAVAVTYQKADNEVWVTPTGDGGGDTTARTSQTSTIASHISVIDDDLVDFYRAQCDDSGALTVPTITQTGVTYDTVTEYPATALLSGTSNDIAADGGYRTATAGPSSAAAVVTGTSAASEQHGAWMTRLRVVPTIELTLLDAAPALYAPTIFVPSQDITLGLLDAANALYAPTVLPVNQLTLGLLDSGPALYAPEVLPQAVSITLDLLDAGAALYAPELVATYVITLDLLDAGPALYAPAVISDQFVTLGLLDAGPALYAPALVATNQLTLGLLDAGPALYAPTLSPVNQLTLGLLDAGSALYAPTLSMVVGLQTISSASVVVATTQQGSPSQNEIQTITVSATGGTYMLDMAGPGAGQFGGAGGLTVAYNASAATLSTLINEYLEASVGLAGNVYTVEFLGNAGLEDWPQMTADGSNLDGSALYAPTVSAVNQFTLGLLDAGPALYAPTLSTVNLLSLDLLDGSPVLYAPTLTTSGGAQALTLPLLDAGGALYAPAVVAGAVALALPLLDAAAALYAPTVTPQWAISLGLLDGSPSLYAPTISPGAVTIGLALLDAAAALYAPTLTTGNARTIFMSASAGDTLAPDASVAGEAGLTAAAGRTMTQKAGQ